MGNIPSVPGFPVCPRFSQNTKTSVLDSTLSVTTKFNVNTDANGNVSVSASSTVANISGHAYSDGQLATMGKEIGAIQQAGATMGFGENTTQLLTAVAANETAFGTARASEPSPFKAPIINPLQLSGGRANGDLTHNIQGALGVLKDAGSFPNYAPLATYFLYSDHSRPTMFNFAHTWSSLTEQDQ